MVKLVPSKPIVSEENIPERIKSEKIDEKEINTYIESKNKKLLDKLKKTINTSESSTEKTSQPGDSEPLDEDFTFEILA